MSPLAREEEGDMNDAFTYPTNFQNVTPPEFDDMVSASMKSTLPPLHINVE